MRGFLQGFTGWLYQANVPSSYEVSWRIHTAMNLVAAMRIPSPSNSYADSKMRS